MARNYAKDHKVIAVYDNITLLVQVVLVVLLFATDMQYLSFLTGLMSYAIQAQPSLAWREYLLIAAAAIWGMYVLVAYGLIGT